ncbi:hypothetical protein J2Z65_003403 [Paenibacillus aceris]|uniref:Uncharacterized protein n=1 Tax=Paenibacillus aceris TaxID=869555 RepID=A0ABS4HZW3_9BACL|nr:hypothetical protein [Paenibacillus aceris]
MNKIKNLLKPVFASKLRIKRPTGDLPLFVEAIAVTLRYNKTTE